MSDVWTETRRDATIALQIAEAAYDGWDAEYVERTLGALRALPIGTDLSNVEVYDDVDIMGDASDIAIVAIICDYFGV